MADNIARTLSDAAVRNAKAQAKPYKLTDGVDRVFMKGSVVRVVISGVATVEVGD